MQKIKDEYSVENECLFVLQAEIDRQVRDWDKIAKQAERAGLIHMAASGVMVLVHPQTQIDEGLYQKCQIATGNRHRMTEEEQVDAL